MMSELFVAWGLPPQHGLSMSISYDRVSPGFLSLWEVLADDSLVCGLTGLRERQQSIPGMGIGS